MGPTLASLALLLLSVTAPIAGVQRAPDDEDAENGMKLVELGDVGPELVQLMREGIGVKAPNNGFHLRMERTSVFDGSFDWHSCVIAHWALLVTARVENDAELQGFVLERLTPASLITELELLADRQRSRIITYPYDEAWFLMLLSELARHADAEGVDRDALAGQRIAVEERLLAWLEASPFPEGVPKADYCGFYRSWLFTFFLVERSHPIVEGASERLAALRESRLEPGRAGVLALETSHDWDFLWLPAILGLVDRTSGLSSRDFAPYDPGPALQLPDSVTIPTVHQLGVELSRLWPCAWDAWRGDEAARAAFEARTRTLLERRDLWAEDFAACSHWVPQYLWLGFWFGAGCP